MWIKALTRFNGRDAGTVFETTNENAKVWIDEGIAEETDEPEAEDVEGRTVAWLKGALRDAEVEIPSGARKADLLELYAKHIDPGEGA